MASPVKENPLADQTYHYGYQKNFRTALPQFLAVSVKNLLLLSYGMTLGFSTILIPAVQTPKEGEILHLEASEISWISSMNLIVVPIGCALSGVVTTPLGRRRAMQMVNIPFFIAWLMFHYSTNVGHLYGALFLTGLAGGLLEAPVLTYVAEITQPHLRGALTATSSMCIIIGVFTQFLFGIFMYWRNVALVNIIFTSLQWLRGWTNPEAVKGELKDIQALFKRKKVESGDQEETLWEKISLYLDRSFLVPFFLVSYSFFVGHFSGMTTLQTYAVSIFQMLEAPIDKYYATLILGILQILGSGVCVILVHYTGKRPLTFFSTAAAGVCCVLVAGYDGYFKTHDVLNNTASVHNVTIGENSNNFHNPYSWIPTTLLMLLALVTHTGIRLLPWILIGEVFSAKTRSGAAGLSSAVGYIFGFLTNKIYITMVDQLSIWGTYGLYGFICLTGCIVLHFILPETEGKKLNDIENHFSGVKHLTNGVYRSQKNKPIEISRLRDLKGITNPSFERENSSNL